VTAMGTACFVASSLPPDPVQDARDDQAVRPPPGAGARFTLVPTAVVQGHGLGLSALAKLLYVVLRSYADPEGACFPGYARLQDDVGCGINQLTRAMRELEGAGLLTRRRRGQGKPTLYTVHAPPTSAVREPGQFHRWSESRLTAGVNQDSPERRAEQDSGNQDPGEQQHRASPPPAPTSGDDALVAALISYGITPRIARSLHTAHAAEAIREQLTWASHRPPAKNPAGALVQAIRERWPAPPAWREAQERAAAVARQAEEERRRREEDEALRRAWAAKPPEERIAGRLAFWLQGRRFKGQEPTAAEVASKRVELLAHLAGLGGPPGQEAAPTPPSPGVWWGT
jgi:hypothetical protein